MKYRSIWISDVHLGTRHAQVGMLLDFLRENKSQYLYIVGDFIDGWELGRNWFWNGDHNVLVQKILRKNRKETEVTLITGNHDEFLEQFIGLDLAGIRILREVVHEGADGRRYLVIHGHQFDGLVSCNRLLERMGSVLYRWILDFNVHFNRLRRRLGFGYWSVAAYLKMKAKSAVSYVADYEEALVSMAREKNVQGVICGHIHRAERRVIDGIEYLNCGDWVESCTALVEDFDGQIQLLNLHEDPLRRAGGGPGAHDPGHRPERVTA